MTTKSLLFLLLEPFSLGVLLQLSRRKSWTIISDAFFPDWIGGLQRYATELASAISQGDAEVTICTRIWSRHGKSELRGALSDVRICTPLSFAPKSMRGIFLTASSLLGIPFHVFDKSTVRIAHTAILGNLFLAKSRDRVQIYVFHASPSLELAAQVAERGKSGLGQRTRIAVLRRLEESCLRKADAVVVLSSFSLGILRSAYPWIAAAKVTIIPGGSSIKEIQPMPRIAFGSKRFVALRRLEWRTGIDLLINAFAESNLVEQGWSLDIVGTGSLYPELVALAERLGVTDNITFHGVVSEEKKHALLSEAQMFVLPTRAFEGFGLATAEAMAHGTVPIVTAAGASPEIVGQLHSQLICEPTIEGLVSALRYWAADENQALIPALGVRAREAALGYDWEEVVRSYFSLVAACAAAKSSR